MNPLDLLSGPQFLVLYAVLFVAVSFTAARIRWLFRTPADEPEAGPFELSPYDIAYLGGGGELAVNAALASLVQQGDLVVDAARRSVSARRTLGPHAHPLERAVAPDPKWSEGRTIFAARWSARGAFAEIYRRLADSGLVVSGGQAWASRVTSALPFFGLLALGVRKVSVGIDRGKPVEFLGIFCLVTMIVGINLLISRPLRTRRGDHVLGLLQREHAALRHAGLGGKIGFSGADMVLAIGLFGMEVLAGGSLADLYTALVPPSDEGGGGGE